MRAHKNYIPSPVDTTDIQLPKELDTLVEVVAQIRMEQE